MSHGVKLDLQPLFQLRKDLAPAVERALDSTLDQARQTAKFHAHVVSGAMQAGTYTATHTKSGYQAAAAAAQSADPEVNILPEVPRPAPGSGVLSNATEQSLYEEFGTVKHGPHPFLMPAAIEAEKVYPDHLEREIKKILPP